MSLNIKSERVHELAREAARLTGKSQTSVVEEALKLLIAEYSQEAREVERRQRIDVILAEIHAVVTDESRASMQRTMDELYDEETGLPV